MSADCRTPTHTKHTYLFFTSAEGGEEERGRGVWLPCLLRGPQPMRQTLEGVRGTCLLHFEAAHLLRAAAVCRRPANGRRNRGRFHRRLTWAVEAERRRLCAADGLDDDGVLLLEVAAEESLGKGRLQLPLHGALHRPRPVGRVVAAGRDEINGGFVEVEPHLLCRKALPDALGLQPNDPLDLFHVERVKEKELVYPVNELGPEARPHSRHDTLPGRLLVGLNPGKTVEHLEHAPASQVAGQNEHRVLEADDPALTVGDAPIIEDLEHDIEDVAVGLLHLIKQDDAVGPPADVLGQLTALLKPDVPRWGADEAAHAVLLHVLAHVDPDHRVLAVEEGHRESLGELCLPDACGAQEHERGDGAVGVRHACPRALDRIRDDFDGLVLADDAAMELVREVEELVPLRLHKLGHGDPGPFRDDVRNVGLRDLLSEHLGARLLL
mmetsp:Transcript_40637/g.96547  ORF Transcript_40637/g.96547 Transcript_40637/m.96547 type:complete len:439 (+) Transcript_40637:40-1356(+)